MSLRLIEHFSRVLIPVARRHQVYRPFLTCLFHNDYCQKSLQMRSISTATGSYTSPGIFQNLVHNIKLQFKKYKLKAAGYHLYESVADNVDYHSFLKEFRMPDTFHSWFLVTELHVWMLMSMLMAEPKYGRYIRNSMVEAMWSDVSARAKKLCNEQPSLIKSQIHELSEEFQAALVNYDEGLLSNDTVLAGAIWRRFLMRSQSCSAQDLEVMVKYIRKSMLLLDQWNIEVFLKEKTIKWTPLKDIYDGLPR
ncbi:hypothetical protein O3M35_009672 [Rhynocoris fuscipes]|uniref:Ubiquinol-cytochrome c chaperone domain-containing protein n=1 Tax=Rhynocoris fuscipes TaxID=488301 RepID=A0AAW1D9Q4_9HEMI